MKVGDLALTHRGNLVLVKNIGRDKNGKIDWYDIIFCSSGNLRTGFPSGWLRKYKNESR